MPPEHVPSDDLLPQVYDELRRLAEARMRRLAPGQTLQATALVHEAWLELRDQGTWNGRGHFFGAAAQAMRDIVVDRARAKGRQKRGGDRERVAFDADLPVIETGVSGDDLLALDEALTDLQREHPRPAEIVLRRYFAGQSNAEIAADLSTSVRTVERGFRFARAWLAQRLGGTPPDLGDGD